MCDNKDNKFDRASYTKELWKDEEYREKVLKAINKPEVKEKRANITKRNWDKKSKEEKEKIISILKEYAQSDEGRKQSSENLKQLWKEEWFREKMNQINSDSGWRWTKEAKEKAKKRWTPERKKQHSEFLKQYFKDNPECRKVMSEKKKGIVKTLQHKMALSKAQKKRWTKKARKKQSEKRKGIVFSQETKLKLSVSARKRALRNDPDNLRKKRALESAEWDLERYYQDQRRKENE